MLAVIERCIFAHPEDRKAFDLLMSHLTSSQRTTLVDHGYFEVQGNEGRWYLLQYGMTGYVRCKDDGVCYGFHPVVNLPSFDIMLIQKLVLQTMETHIRRIACHD